MTNSKLRQAALSAAQGMSAKEAIDLFCQQIAQQKPARKIACEMLESFYATLQAMKPVCAAYAHSIRIAPNGLADAEKKQAMLNWALEKVEGAE